MSRLTRAVRKFRQDRIEPSPEQEPWHHLTCFYEPNSAAPWGIVEHGLVPSDALIDRIKTAYRKSIDAFSPDETSMWSQIDSVRREIHDALLRDDSSAKEILSDPASTPLFFGMDNASNVHPTIANAEVEFDTLIRLTEAMNIQPMYNPELLNWKDSSKERNSRNPDDEFGKICREINLSLGNIPNPFRGTHGLKITKGILDSKTIQAIYCAYKLRQFGAKNILEIGGGLGRAAYFSRALGAARFTIIDIPLTSVCQALYLGLTLGENAIRLDGEADNGQSIHLLTTTNLPNQNFDAVLNSDSMTEIGEEVAKDYAGYIQKHSPIFLSINHEANSFRVGSVFNQPPLYRSPYWLRRGYVEELYKFSPA